MTALQLVALLSRCEAWRTCVAAAGGVISRRRLFHAGGLGNLGSLVNAQVGAAARIAVLRRSGRDEVPHVPALIAAEVPILAIEAALAVLASFTLVGPLGLPWWAPLAGFARRGRRSSTACAGSPAAGTACGRASPCCATPTAARA